MYKAEANGVEEKCFTLQQAVYRVLYNARPMIKQKGTVTFKDGTGKIGRENKMETLIIVIATLALLLMMLLTWFLPMQCTEVIGWMVK